MCSCVELKKKMFLKKRFIPRALIKYVYVYTTLDKPQFPYPFREQKLTSFWISPIIPERTESTPCL